MKYKNLIIIGTSHVAKESLDEVEQTIKSEQPDIVALELDEKRYFALLNKQTQKKKRITLYDIKKVGFKGFLFSLIGAWAEKKIGKLVGVSPGSEMIKAIKLSKKNKIKLVLIDQDIEVTLKRFSQEITWKEKWNFVVDLVKSPFKRKEFESLKLDLTKVPAKSIIKKLIKKVKIRYPNLYKVLIKERNLVMASHLNALMLQYPEKKIVAIIGAGHEEDIIKLLKEKISDHTYTMSFS